MGHSDRRNIFGETDELVNRKLKAALQVKLKPILGFYVLDLRSPRRKRSVRIGLFPVYERKFRLEIVAGFHFSLLGSKSELRCPVRIAIR